MQASCLHCCEAASNRPGSHTGQTTVLQGDDWGPEAVAACSASRQARQPSDSHHARCRVEAAQTGRLEQQQRALEQAVAELRAAEGELRRLVGDKPSHADVAQLLAAQAAPATLQVGRRSLTSDCMFRLVSAACWDCQHGATYPGFLWQQLLAAHARPATL